MTALASIPADVSRRLLFLTCAAALITAACSTVPEVNVDYGKGVEFVPYVADHLDNSGLGNAVALDKDGTPFVSYLIFPAKVAKGEIALPRPIGAPFIATLTANGATAKEGGAVGVASVASDGIWTRGAAAQVIDSPAGIIVPYGPATVDSLIGSTANNTNGTDIAVDANGGKHVVWTQPDGVWYAGATTAGFSTTQLYKQDPPLTQAGPVGRPSVAVDSSGNPSVAFMVDTAKGQSVEVASYDGTKWSKPMIVATVPLSTGGSQPAPTPIATTADGPIVAYVDGSAGALMAARQQADGSWTTETIAGGITPSGPSLAVGSDGTVAVSYYDGKGAVNVATSTAAGVWTPTKVADANPGTGTGNYAQTTGVAIDDAGAVYVTWRDDATKSVMLASGGGSNGAFTPIDTRGTNGGSYPSLGVTPDGSRVYVAWYGTGSQDLRLGILGEVGDLQVAAPSPTPSVSLAPPVVSTCPKGGVKLTAPSGAAISGYAETDLTAPANTAFTICFDNQDTGVPHNVDLFDTQGGTSLAKANIITGVAQANVDVSALKPGTYFYQCDVHPTTMTGTLTVK